MIFSSPDGGSRRVIPATTLFFALVCTLTFAIPSPAQNAFESQPVHGEFQGVNIPTEQAENCITPAQRTMLEEKIEAYENNPATKAAKSAAGLPKAAILPGPNQYPFFPQAGVLNQDLTLVNYVDLNPTTGLGPLSITDWSCGQRTYDGHTGLDISIRGFQEQALGMPVLAALDGWVVDAHDGEFDMQTLAGINQCGPGFPPANYVILDHGNAHYSVYFHFKAGSVPLELFVPGAFVRAGTQIGLTGSSGCSTGPHLHFESWYGAPAQFFKYEPFSGTCNVLARAWDIPSGWVEQPVVRLSTYARGFAFSPLPFEGAAAFPFDQSLRVGTFPLGFQRIFLRHELTNLPAFSFFQLVVKRPGGVILGTLNGGFGNVANSVIYDAAGYLDLNFDQTGQWSIELTINNQTASRIITPFDVVSTPSQIVNRAPLPVTTSFKPSAPTPNDVIFCQVQTNLVRRDPDYDIVGYRYEWKVNGVTRRSVPLSAALSDALPLGLTKVGDTVTCTVTPTDGRTTATASTSSVNVSQSTMRFGSSTYSVSENVGAAAITITRAGSNLPATVSYASAGGTASDRTDYTTATGTLVFGAGETTKTLNVLITDDGFIEANETIVLTLSDPTGGALDTPSTTTLTIRDNDTAATPNPVADPTFFVRQHYSDFLNRVPDASGLNFWTNEIASCGSDAQCIEAKRINVSAAYFLSIEFQQTGYLVYRFYKSSFGRIPRLAEFLPDTQLIGQNVVVGASGWEAQLEANKAGFANAWVNRPAFKTLYDAKTNAAYVDALIANTGAQFTQTERNALVNGLTSSTETRATVLRKITDNADFQQKEFNPAFVLMQYFGYLRRNPNDAPEQTLDFSGYNFWLAKLNQFNGDYAKADMVKAFINSSEYRARFGQN